MNQKVREALEATERYVRNLIVSNQDPTEMEFLTTFQDKIKSALDAMNAMVDRPAEPWTDRPDDLTPAIDADHPMLSGKHETFGRAMELVGNRHSKYALVGLVHHLLLEIERAKG